jgi:hypothetical protein
MRESLSKILDKTRKKNRRCERLRGNERGFKREIVVGRSDLELTFSKTKFTKTNLHTPTIFKIENAL